MTSVPESYKLTHLIELEWNYVYTTLLMIGNN